MKNNNVIQPFREDEIDWKELEAIGISKEQLDALDELPALLNGKKTNPITLELVLLGVDVILDATLQAIRFGDSKPIVEIVGIEPAQLN